MQIQKHHSKAHHPKANGDESEPEDIEAQEASPPPEYEPEDFSQLAINRGQRMINYELTVVNAKLAKAIEKLKDAIEEAKLGEIDFGPVKDALKAVSKANSKVAGIIPPGCQGGATTTTRK